MRFGLCHIRSPGSSPAGSTDGGQARTAFELRFAFLLDAARVNAERLPGVAAAFRARHWPLPQPLDRVYASSAATQAFEYRPVHGIHQMLPTPGNGPAPTPPE